MWPSKGPGTSRADTGGAFWPGTGTRVCVRGRGHRSGGYTGHRVQVHRGATAESHIHTSCRSLGVRGPLCAVTDGSIPLLKARMAKDREMHKSSSYCRESNRSQVNRSETHRVLRSHNHLFQRSKRSVEKLLTQKRGRGSERHLPPPPSEALGEDATLRTQ